ncbi:MAG: imidazoleglycerol-phosphate dehydratase HisB [Candidatus Firestonebacteria bacterium]|nr:imidazoleglycerol-phosphate dehydratase HisB [Candidatus Firestonebacteria bacterium]
MRKAIITRNTKETKISLKLNLDGKGIAKICTCVPFLDHMLTLFTCHGLFDLEVKAEGDLDVDCHHTVEDIGICLGEAINKSLQDKKSINRYGMAVIPMDESLVLLSLDISGRPYLGYKLPRKKGKIGNFDLEMVEEFYRSVANNAFITLHIQALAGTNLHHLAEASFKAFARALSSAVSINPRIKGIPSTKGML